MTKNTKMLVNCAMLVAIEIVLARFCSISAWNIRIGFSFLAPALAAILYGPVTAGIVYAVADILGATLFPTGGAYFPGFTLTAFITGVLFGLFLYKKQDLKRIIGCVIAQQVLCSLFMNTLWISILYGSSFRALFVTRLTQAAIVTPVQIIVIYGASKVLNRIGRQVFA